MTAYIPAAVLPQEWREEPIGGGISVIVSKDHTFGTDAFLLSDFAGIKPTDSACDLGCGCGIIPMLWFRHTKDGTRKPPKQVYAVDIQPQAIEQLKLAIERQELENLIPLCADLKDLKGQIPAASLDLVTCNPPYKAANSGILSEWTSEQIARHELLCNIDDVCQAAARLLKFGGRLCICQRPERLADVIAAMRQAKIEPKRLRMVQKRPDSPPWLFLIEGKKGAKPFLQIEAPLITHTETGYSPEMLRLYEREDA